MRYGKGSSGLVGVTLKPKAVQIWANSLHICTHAVKDLDEMRSRLTKLIMRKLEECLKVVLIKTSRNTFQHAIWKHCTRCFQCFCMILCKCSSEKRSRCNCTCSGIQLSCSEFCVYHGSHCENQWTVKESSDVEEERRSDIDSDSN